MWSRLRPVAAVPSLFLELGESVRPVIVQGARDAAVRRQPSLVLAESAVVGLAVGVRDALHGRAAVRARLSVAAIHGHFRAERRHLLRATVTGLHAQALDPLLENGLRRGERSRDRLVVQALREQRRRETRAVQDLVRVRVPMPSKYAGP